VRAAIFGPASIPTLGHIAAGLDALGFRLTRHEDRGAYSIGDCEPRRFDFVVTDGIRGPMRVMRDEYVMAGIPVLVTDLGFLRRDRGFYQIGVDGLNWLPPKPCPPDRFKALEVVLHRKRPGGDYILITGQKPGDGSHHMSAGELAKMYRGWIDEIRGQTDREIVFRPHPKEGSAHGEVRLEGVTHDLPSDEKSGGLAEAIAGAWCVVTHNSTTGTDALIAGVPVFSDPGAQYGALANIGWEALEAPSFPTAKARRDHFARVAYAQWTLDELADGSAVEFILEAIA
jgi:hypothetical protein